MTLHFDHIPTVCQECGCILSTHSVQAEDRRVWGKKVCESCDTLHFFDGVVGSAEVRVDPYE